jgi:dipeptidase D
VDIHLQRGNAIQLLARSLLTARRAAPFRLAALEGGGKHNAIPREAFAVVVAAAAQLAAIRRALETEAAAVRDEYRSADPEMRFEVADAPLPATAWDDVTSHTVLHLLTGLPHGVIAMSHDIPGLVETSTNLATVAVRDGHLAVGLSSRSSVASALRALRLRICAIAALAGAAVQEPAGYPGWKPNLASPLLDVLKRVHRRMLGTEPEVKAIHAGLECGIIGERVPGMDMISFGPQIEFPHSPDERVRIDSVERFYRLLTAVLAELARSPAA